MSKIIEIKGKDMYSSLDYENSNTANYINKLPEVISWLTQKGFNAEVSRYSRYLAYISNVSLSPKNPKEIVNPEKVFNDGNTSLKEIIEIAIVYEAFKDVESSGLNERLKKVVSGKDFYEDGEQDQPRDFLYELLIAAMFQQLGYTIDFDRETDVVAMRGDIIVYGECKRIKSINGLEKNYRKACKQLGKIKGHSDKIYKFAFIDVWNCFSEHIKPYEYKDIFSMLNHVNKCYEEYFKKSINVVLNKVSNEYSDVIDGFALTYYCCLWLSNITPQYLKKINITLNPKMSNEEFDFIQTSVLK